MTMVGVECHRPWEQKKFRHMAAHAALDSTIDRQFEEGKVTHLFRSSTRNFLQAAQKPTNVEACF